MPFSSLTICSSEFIENFYRLFTPSSHLGPFTREEHPRRAGGSLSKGRDCRRGGRSHRVRPLGKLDPRAFNAGTAGGGGAAMSPCRRGGTSTREDQPGEESRHSMRALPPRKEHPCGWGLRCWANRNRVRGEIWVPTPNWGL
jgi:hypothetical protein